MNKDMQKFLDALNYHHQINDAPWEDLDLSEFSGVPSYFDEQCYQEDHKRMENVSFILFYYLDFRDNRYCTYDQEFDRSRDPHGTMKVDKQRLIKTTNYMMDHEDLWEKVIFDKTSGVWREKENYGKSK
jgi:hypothetical protein